MQGGTRSAPCRTACAAIRIYASCCGCYQSRHASGAGQPTTASQHQAAVEPVPPRFSSAGAIVTDLRQQSSAEPDKPRGTLRDAVASDSMAVAFPATLRFSLADAVRSDFRQGGAYCRAARVWKQTASRCQVTGFHRCSAYLRASRFHESLMGQAAVQHHSLDGSLTVRAVSSHAACS